MPGAVSVEAEASTVQVAVRAAGGERRHRRHVRVGRPGRPGARRSTWWPWRSRRARWRCGPALVPAPTGGVGVGRERGDPPGAGAERRCCAGSGRPGASSRWSPTRTCRPSRRRRRSRRSPTLAPGVVCGRAVDRLGRRGERARRGRRRCRRRRAGSGSTWWSPRRRPRRSCRRRWPRRPCCRGWSRCRCSTSRVPSRVQPAGVVGDEASGLVAGDEEQQAVAAHGPSRDGHPGRGLVEGRLRRRAEGDGVSGGRCGRQHDAGADGEGPGRDGQCRSRSEPSAHTARDRVQ